MQRKGRYHMGVITIAKKENINLQEVGNGLKKGIMLPDAFPGIETYKCQLKAGSRIDPELYNDKIQIFFFTKGTGYVANQHEAFNIKEIAYFIPMQDEEPFFIQAGTDMEFLHLVVTMNEYDKSEFKKVRVFLPDFNNLSTCPRYYEGFKGPGVKSYTIVEHDNLARISMGVIQGDGPEEVGEHCHDYLHQWYYGLKDADFSYTAGGDTVHVEEGDWMCIPKGTPHSSKGNNINYLWFEVKCGEPYDK